MSKAGCIEEAVKAINVAREERLGHLEAAKRKSFKGLSERHASYLKECAEQGVPSRREQRLVREEAKNHGSVYSYEEELLQKAWKDGAYGAALFDPAEPGVEELLSKAQVAESRLGSVPKQTSSAFKKTSLQSCFLGEGLLAMGQVSVLLDLSGFTPLLPAPPPPLLREGGKNPHSGRLTEHKAGLPDGRLLLRPQQTA